MKEIGQLPDGMLELSSASNLMLPSTEVLIFLHRRTQAKVEEEFFLFQITVADNIRKDLYYSKNSAETGVDFLGRYLLSLYDGINSDCSVLLSYF